MADREWLLRAAKTAGWEVEATQDVTLINRGDELIEIEYGTAGLPRTIRRTDQNGNRTVTSQSYIRMNDVLQWLSEPVKDKDQK